MPECEHINTSTVNDPAYQGDDGEWYYTEITTCHDCGASWTATILTPNTHL